MAGDAEEYSTRNKGTHIAVEGIEKVIIAEAILLQLGADHGLCGTKPVRVFILNVPSFG